MSSAGASRGRGRGKSRASSRHVPLFDSRAAASAITGEGRLGRGGKIVPLKKTNPSICTTLASTTAGSSSLTTSTASASAPPPNIAFANANPITSATTSATISSSIARVSATTTPSSDASCSKKDVGSTSHSAVSFFESSRVVHKGTASIADLPLDKGSSVLPYSKQSDDGPSTSGRRDLQEESRLDSQPKFANPEDRKRRRIVFDDDIDDYAQSLYGGGGGDEGGNSVPLLPEPHPRPPPLASTHSAAAKGRDSREQPLGFPRVQCNTETFLKLLDSSSPSRLRHEVAHETEPEDLNSESVLSDFAFDIDDVESDDDEAEDVTYMPDKLVRKTSDLHSFDEMEARFSDDEPAPEKVADRSSSSKEGRSIHSFSMFTESKSSTPAFKGPLQLPRVGSIPPRQTDHGNSGRSLPLVTGPSARRTAPVWSFFQIFQDQDHVVQCSICRRRVRRGKAGSANLGTSSMRQHMQRFHSAEWRKSQANESGSSVSVHTGTPVQQKNSAHSTPGSLPVQVAVQECLAPIFSPAGVGPAAVRQPKQLRQQSFTESSLKGTPYPRSHDRVRLLNAKLTEMLALEMLPYSLVDKKSFRDFIYACDPRWKIPSRSYFSRQAVPDLYREVAVCVGKALDRSECQNVHLTTDMWSGGKSDYMAVTAHWVIFPPSNSSSQAAEHDSYRQHATLCMANFEGKTHTGSNLLKKLHEVTTEWLTARNLNVGFVASDNGSNIVSALSTGNIPRVPCFAHVLHLVVSRFLREVEPVKCMVGRARRICSHFSRSYSARNALRILQQNYQLPAHQLKVDVPTRWNSILHMLDRLHEQQKAITEYCHTNHKLLSGSHMETLDWHLMPTVCKALRPFEEATLKVSRGDVGLNEILTLTFVLEKKLSMLSEKWTADELDDEHNLYQRLLEFFLTDARIVMIKKSDEYLLASFLDPRFKASVGQLVPPPRTSPGQAQVSTLEHCKRLLVSKVRKYLKQDQLDKEQHGNDDTVQLSLPNVSRSKNSASAAQRPGAGSKSHLSGDDEGGSLMDLYSQFGLCVPSTVAQSTGPNALEIVQAYMNDTSCTLGVNDDPLLYWQSKRQVWPGVLVRCAVEYLSCPPASVMSERVFSAAGAIITDRRSCLSSRNVEKLTFVKMNEQYIPLDYGKRPLESSRKRSTNDEAVNSRQYSEENRATNVPLASSPSVSADTSLSSLVVMNDSEWESEPLSSDEGCRAWPDIDED